VNDFVEQFLNENWEGVRDAPRIYVAAFGKHPAWNDHLDDIGLVTGSLVTARRMMYGSGIAAQIESAAWEKAGPEKTMATFDHVLLWRRGAESLVGRIWSSRDGKGRTLYPMAVVVHAIAQPFERIANDVLPALLHVEGRCLPAKTPSEVIAALNDTQEKLRGRAGGGAEALAVPDSTLGIRGWAAWAIQERPALERVIHHLRGQWMVFGPEQRGWCEAEGPAQSRILRVPRVPGSTPAEALNAWISFVATQINPAVPLLGLVHRDQPWVEVIAGEPAPGDWFVLRANAAAVPLVTDIPYQIDAETRAASTLLFADLVQGRLPTRSALNGRSLAENRESADKWLSRFRGSMTRAIFGRLLSGGGARSNPRFDLNVR